MKPDEMFFILTLLVLIIGVCWSFDADSLMSQEEWVVEWDVPTASPDSKPLSDIAYDNEQVISYLSDGSSSGSLWEEMGWVIIAPVALIGAVFAAVTCYSCYKGECCCCKCFTNYGRKVANTYTPGMKIDKDGNVEYYEMTQEEQEAMQELIETVTGPAH